jgi:hypothetical protein
LSLSFDHWVLCVGHVAFLLDLTKLWPELTNGNDQAWGNYVRYWAALSKEDAGAACKYINEAIRVATDSAAKSKYSKRADVC